MWVIKLILYEIEGIRSPIKVRGVMIILRSMLKVSLALMVLSKDGCFLGFVSHTEALTIAGIAPERKMVSIWKIVEKSRVGEDATIDIHSLENEE